MSLVLRTQTTHNEVYKTGAACPPHPEETNNPCYPASQDSVAAPRIGDSLGRKEVEGIERDLQLALTDVHPYGT